MIGRLLKWNAERREWHRAHELAWAGMTEPNESGLSPFQLMCEPAVVSALRDLGVAVADREILKMKGPYGGVNEPYVKARLAATPWTLWVYVNAAEVTADKATLVRLEDWDAKTPEDFVHDFVQKMCSRIRNHSERSV